MQSVEEQTGRLARAIIHTFENEGKLLICGNGGSAAEADHMAAELVGKFIKDESPALPALALSCSGAILTSLGNDRGYEDVFSRQVEAFGKRGDILMVITTSDAFEGHSVNLQRALEQAREQEMLTAGLISRERTRNILELIDLPVMCEGKNTPTIQERQIEVVHNICAMVEEALI